MAGLSMNSVFRFATCRTLSNCFGEFSSMLVKLSPMPAIRSSKAGLFASAGPQQPMGRRNVLLARLPQRLDRFPIAPRDQFAHRDQVSSPFVFRRRQDMQKQALDHGPRRLIPERIVAFVDDDNGVGNPPGLVDGFLIGGVERVERVEPAPETVVHLRRLERVQNLDRLPEAPGNASIPCPVWRP